MAVEVFTVHHEQAFFNIRIVFEQRGGFKRGEGFAAAGGVPDVAIAPVLVDAIDNRLDRIDLVRAHDHQLLLAGDQYHVAADHLAQRAFGQKAVGKVVQVGDFLVVFIRQLVNRQKALVGVKAEVLVVVVGKVVGIAFIADNKQLHKTQQRVGVAVAGVVFVIDDLLHGTARADLEGFQLNLHHRHAVDQQNHVITVVAVIGIDAQLVDDFKVVFAPVFDVDQGVMQRCTVFTLKVITLAQGFGGGENVGGDDFVAQAGEFCIG